jgi:hypothetical protein
MDTMLSWFSEAPLSDVAHTGTLKNEFTTSHCIHIHTHVHTHTHGDVEARERMVWWFEGGMHREK